ncbi:hypothetical protein HYPSUDRAFT_117612, partial [Hypholoma sublateritium FD-334 SS-4]
LGVLPLVIGMPIVILNDFDVEGGIVNGTRGYLTQIRYKMNEFNERVALSCVIKISNCSASKMHGLPPQQMPVIADTVSVQFLNR